MTSFYSYEGFIDIDRFEQAKRGVNKYHLGNQGLVGLKAHVSGDFHLQEKGLRGDISYALVDPYDGELKGHFFFKNYYGTSKIPLVDFFLPAKTVIQFVAQSTFHDRFIFFDIFKQSIDKDLAGRYFGYWGYVSADICDCFSKTYYKKPEEYFRQLRKRSRFEHFANFEISSQRSGTTQEDSPEDIPELSLVF
ncbi:MAG: hypothetical protein KC535_05595 [Nanoarchaeota archaeon]|nr:hypothetical protein [Nanoarchaeota archaeon]